MDDKKCQRCDAKFATEEQLQRHSQRHEMTINLSMKASSSVASTSLSTPSQNKGSLSAGVINFVDETPTPTRFIRNCEEVGLFQDLQNVNPFDEDFKKAANGSATPSGGGNSFEFMFSSSMIGILGTPSSESGVARNTRSKRRYSEQDTLNTPQVFPYLNSTGGCHTLTTNTASMSACLTPTPQYALTNENLNSELHQTIQVEPSNNNVSTTSYNHEEHVSIIAYTSAISQQTKCEGTAGNSGKTSTDSPKSAEMLGKKVASTITSTPITDLSSSRKIGKMSSLKNRSKTNLKLDLKTVIVRNKSSTLSEKVSNRDSLQKVSESFPSSDNFGRKETLERNRAAAYRSRERRKQWIYGLESRCRALESLLAQSQADVVRLKAENEALKAQLQTENKDVSHSASEVIPSNLITDDTTKPQKTAQKMPEPIIVQESLADDVKASSEFLAVSPIVLPTVKSKRGRPRKGEERRVPVLSVPMSSASEKQKVLPKIPILPVPHAKKQKI